MKPMRNVFCFEIFLLLALAVIVGAIVGGVLDFLFR